MSRILVAEDNPITAEMIATRLSNAGYEVVRAENGHQTLERSASSRPDLILLDVMMPDLDGFEALRRLKADPLLGAIPVLMVSARTQEQDILAALALGAEDYVTKPFSFRELLARIERVLAEGPGNLRATVRGVAGDAFVGEVVDGDARSLSLRFSNEIAPVFAIGELVSISLRSAALETPLDSDARVVARAEAEPNRTYRLKLDTRPTADPAATEAFLRLISRRAAARVTLAPKEHVDVTVIAKRSGETLELAGSIQDISASGARLLLKADADRLLFSVASLRIRFRLPGGDASLELPASIRHRAAAPDGIFYGIHFETGGEPELLEHREEISNFVFSRQRAEA